MPQSTMLSWRNAGASSRTSVNNFANSVYQPLAAFAQQNSTTFGTTGSNLFTGQGAFGRTPVAPTSGTSSKILQIGERDLQKVFMKHGTDFGMTGNWNPARATDISRAINSRINSAGIQAIKGTYRGQNVIHYLDPKTGLNVISNPSGGFIGGWKLGPDQLKSVTTNGRLF